LDQDYNGEAFDAVRLLATPSGGLMVCCLLLLLMLLWIGFASCCRGIPTARVCPSIRVVVPFLDPTPIAQDYIQRLP